MSQLIGYDLGIHPITVPRRTHVKKVIALVTAALVAGAIAATTIPAGAQAVEDSTITVDVTKEVVNAPQLETSFTIKLTCSDADDVESASQIVKWFAPGNSPWHLDPEDGAFTLSVTDNWDDDVTCVLSETVNGGAVSTTITCVDDTSATCDGASLYIDAEDLYQDVIYGEFEVVNTFAEVVPTTVPSTTIVVEAAAPASAVVGSPRFTG